MPSGGCVCGNVRYEVAGGSEANVCIHIERDNCELIGRVDSLSLHRLQKDLGKHILQQRLVLLRGLQGHQGNGQGAQEEGRWRQ